MTVVYTDEQRGFAKAVAIAYGSSARAHVLLTALADAPGAEWPEAPSANTLTLWRRDPTIEPDTEVVDAFAKELQLTVTAQIQTLLEPLHKRALATIKDEGSKPSDIHNLAKAYALLVDKVVPKQAGATVITGPTQINATGTANIMRLFGPKEVEAPPEPDVIEVEARTLETSER